MRYTVYIYCVMCIMYCIMSHSLVYNNNIHKVQYVHYNIQYTLCIVCCNVYIALYVYCVLHSTHITYYSVFTQFITQHMFMYTKCLLHIDNIHVNTLYTLYIIQYIYIKHYIHYTIYNTLYLICAVHMFASVYTK